MDDEKESTWEAFKKTFRPTHVRAEESVREDKKKYGNQLELDMRKSREERAKKIKDGFFSR